jgi:hypothetical protein
MPNPSPTSEPSWASKSSKKRKNIISGRIASALFSFPQNRHGFLRQVPEQIILRRLTDNWIGLVFVIAAQVAVASTPAPMTSQERQQSRAVFGYDPTPEFVAFDPQYRQKRNEYFAQLEQLQQELARQAAQGRATPCSRQIFLEARWLVLYSAYWDRIESRLHDLRQMLARPADPPDAREQVPDDGSFDGCSDAWFLKLDSTIEEVEAHNDRGEPIRFPLKILDRVNTPDKLRSYLDSLLISEVRRTGIDNRFELNIAITAIERFIVGHVRHDYPFPPDLRQALFDYQDKGWQDPQTGFFGGWYRLPDGSLRKTADLSVTFHIVSYRRDTIKHLPEMMRTLIAMKDCEYPFGWRQEVVPSNHHNYYVARLFRVGWPGMDSSQRDLARDQMRRMMDFCLRDTMNPDGSFKMMDEDTLGSSFLFPVALLNELGYFRPSLRFWTWESFPDAMKVADTIERRIRAMGLTDTESAKVLRRFEEARRERRAWWAGGILVGLSFLGFAWALRKRLRAARVRRSIP